MRASSGRAFAAGSGSWDGLRGGCWRGSFCGSKGRESESEIGRARVAWLVMGLVWWVILRVEKILADNNMASVIQTYHYVLLIRACDSPAPPSQRP